MICSVGSPYAFMTSAFTPHIRAQRRRMWGSGEKLKSGTLGRLALIRRAVRPLPVKARIAFAPIRCATSVRAGSA